MDGMGIGIPLQILFFPIVIIRNLHLFMVTLSYGEEKRSGGIGRWDFTKTLWWTGYTGYVWHVIHINLDVCREFLKHCIKYATCDYIFDSRCSWIHYAYMFCFLTVRCWAQPEELPVVVLGSFVFKEPVEPSQFGALQFFLKCTGLLKPTVWNQKQYCMGRLLATWEFSRYDGWNCHRNLQQSYILRGSGFKDIFLGESDEHINV